MIRSQVERRSMPSARKPFCAAVDPARSDPDSSPWKRAGSRGRVCASALSGGLCVPLPAPCLVSPGGVTGGAPGGCQRRPHSSWRRSPALAPGHPQHCNSLGSQVQAASLWGVRSLSHTQSHGHTHSHSPGHRCSRLQGPLCPAHWPTRRLRGRLLIRAGSRRPAGGCGWVQPCLFVVVLGNGDSPHMDL